MTTAKDDLLFGVYPGGTTGDDTGGLATGPADDPERITTALRQLQGKPGRPFLVRAYLGFTDATEQSAEHRTLAPSDAARYTGDGRRLDLVAQYQSSAGDIEGYCAFLRDLIGQYGAVTATVQIAEEPNVVGNPTLDGAYPGVIDAIVAGVSAAKREAHRLGHHHLRIGFNTTPLFGPTGSFITDLTAAGGAEFITDLDYVGLDFFPDVFRPVSLEDLGPATAGLLRHHRKEVLAPAGLGDLPLHITENGWPTGPDRTPERQTQVVETVVRTIADARTELNIQAYAHFALRDADSSQPGLFHRFGLTTDDYTPKPAFETYRRLIHELSCS
jgi:hypothetical protein